MSDDRLITVPGPDAITSTSEPVSDVTPARARVVPVPVALDVMSLYEPWTRRTQVGHSRSGPPAGKHGSVLNGQVSVIDVGELRKRVGAPLDREAGVGQRIKLRKRDRPGSSTVIETLLKFVKLLLTSIWPPAGGNEGCFVTVGALASGDRAQAREVDKGPWTGRGDSDR